MLTILMPMAGSGKRFADAGYADPKPLVPVNGVPMARFVIDNLRPPAGVPHRFVFVVRREHDEAFGLGDKLRAWGGPGSEVVVSPGPTDGAARTCLLARDVCPGSDPVLVANCDQWVNPDALDLFFDFAAEVVGPHDAAALTMTVPDRHPRWSYVEREPAAFGGGASARVRRVVEKKPVSDEGTAGLYLFGSADELFAGIDRMVAANDRTNGEVYLAPAMNYVAGTTWACNVGRVGADVFGVGTPDDLAAFLAAGVA